MTSLLSRGSAMLREFTARFRVTRENWPIDSIAELQRFARTRSAFVAQKKLYGYLKTRMGTRYTSVFEDDVFVQSVNIAKMHVFAACLSDLTVHTIAKVTAGSGLGHERRVAVALECFRAGLAESEGGWPEPGAADAWVETVEKRLQDVAWENLGAGGDAFTTSPKALVKWAPIADELKKYDAEIVRNSVRFAWSEVIRDFRLRHDAAAILAEIENREAV